MIPAMEWEFPPGSLVRIAKGSDETGDYFRDVRL
jgi:hypothetical protein